MNMTLVCIKRTIGTKVHKSLPVYIDLGYMGINEFHEKSNIPRKAGKLHSLSGKDK